MLSRLNATAAARSTASRTYLCNLKSQLNIGRADVVWWMQYWTNHPTKILTSLSWYSEYSLTIASWIALATWNCSIGWWECSSRYWHLGSSRGDALNAFRTLYMIRKIGSRGWTSAVCLVRGFWKVQYSTARKVRQCHYKHSQEPLTALGDSQSLPYRGWQWVVKDGSSSSWCPEGLSLQKIKVWWSKVDRVPLSHSLGALW